MEENNQISAPPPSLAAPQDAMPVADRLLRPPRLLPGEKSADCKALQAQILGDIQPKGIFEKMLVGDVIDFQWQILRLRRLKAALLHGKAYDGVREILSPFGDEDDDDFSALPYRWACGDQEARQEVKERLRPAGLGADEIMAATLVQNLEVVERLERLIISLEGRRNNALGEIDHRRQALGAAIRAGVEKVEDAEYREVGGEPISAEAA
jgi:hypothetical protein